MAFRALFASLAAALCAAGAARAAPGSAVEVLVIGDSITAGFGLSPSQAMPARLQAELARRGRPVSVLAAGVFGDTVADGLARVDETPPARVAVVALGANDLLSGVPPQRTRAALHALVGKLRARGARLVLAGGRSPFAAAPAFNALFAQVAREEGVVLAPDILAGVGRTGGAVQPDGLHPNARGAELIAQRLAPAVLQTLEPRP